MQILLVAATPFEIAPVLGWLEKAFQQESEGFFVGENLQIQTLVTGVGMTATAFQLGAYFAQNRPDWAVNAGIAGAFDDKLAIGEVVQVVNERFGDLGVEEIDGRFTDIASMGFAHTAVYANPQAPLPSLPLCTGLTVNKVHGSANSIQQILAQYPDVQVETMEGAAFFYACLAAGIPFTAIRSISNRVEPRNRDAWNIPLAIGRLNEVLVQMLEAVGSGRD